MTTLVLVKHGVSPLEIRIIDKSEDHIDIGKVFFFFFSLSFFLSCSLFSFFFCVFFCWG